MWPNPQFSADFVTFTEEILNEKFHVLWSDLCFDFRIFPIVDDHEKLTKLPEKASLRIYFVNTSSWYVGKKWGLAVNYTCKQGARDTQVLFANGALI